MKARGPSIARSSIAYTLLAIFLVSTFAGVVRGAPTVARVGIAYAPDSVAFDSANGEIYVAAGPIYVFSGSTDGIIAQIPIGENTSYFGDTVFDSSNGDIYVAVESTAEGSTASASVLVISGATDKLVANVSLGAAPHGLAFDSSNGDIYATCFNKDVYVLSGATNKVIATVPVGSQPDGAAFDSANGNIYVANYGDNTVSVISAATNEVVGTVNVGAQPYGVAFDSSNGNVYVADSGEGLATANGSLTVISGSTSAVVNTITVGKDPRGVTYDPANGDVYVSNTEDSTVVAISGTTNSIVDTLTTGTGPEGMAYDSQNGYLYVAAFRDEAVDIFAVSTGVATTSTSTQPTTTSSASTQTATGPTTQIPSLTEIVGDGGASTGVAYDSGKGEVFVTNENENTVTILSDGNNTIIGSVKVGGDPQGIAYDSGMGEMFVADQSGNVSVISDQTNQVVATIPTDSFPKFAAYDPLNGEIFVTCFASPGIVDIISDATDKVVATVTTAAGALGIAYDSEKDEMFVAGAETDSLSVISGSNNSVVATVTLGSPPGSVAYDSGKGEVFATSNHGNTISVVSDATDKVVASGNAGPGATGMAYDSAEGEVFVTNEGNTSVAGTNVYVINDENNAFITGIFIGADTDAATYDGAKGEIFVVESFNNSIAVISDGTGVSATRTASTGTSTASAVSTVTQSGPFYPPSFSSGQAASVVLGQADLTQGVANFGAGYSSGFGGPVANITANGVEFADSVGTGGAGVAVDPSGNVWVLDGANDRVLEFTAPFHSGEAASVVLGEPDFNASSQPGISASTFNVPSAIAVDPSGDVWVVDYYNGRVLEFTPPFTNGEAASIVLGKPDFTFDAGTQYQLGGEIGQGPVDSINLNYPTSVAADPSGNIWVIDDSNRVLEFTAPFTNYEAASIVLGQPDFTSGVQSSNLANRTATSFGLDYPGGLAADSSGDIWVADSYDNRILEFKAPFSTNEAASLVLGQTGFATFDSAISPTGLTNPEGVAVDRAGDVWVADFGANRVLEFKGPVATGQAASVALGEGSLTENTTATSATGMDGPIAVAVDPSGNPWVADFFNNRVLGFMQSAAISSSSAASSSSSFPISYLVLIAANVLVVGILSSRVPRRRNTNDLARE